MENSAEHQESGRREREHQREGKREERERSKADAAPEQNKCVWNIGHTSPMTVTFPLLKKLPAVCTSYKILHNLDDNLWTWLCYFYPKALYVNIHCAKETTACSYCCLSCKTKITNM